MGGVQQMIEVMFVVLAFFGFASFFIGLYLGGIDSPKTPVILFLGIAAVLFGGLAVDSFQVQKTFCENTVVNSTITVNTSTFTNAFACLTNSTVELGMGAVFAGMGFLTVVMLFVFGLKATEEAFGN